MGGGYSAGVEGMGLRWSGCQRIVGKESNLKGSRGLGSDIQGIRWWPCGRRWFSVSRESDVQAI